MKLTPRIASAFVIALGAAMVPAARAGITSATITGDPATAPRHLASLSGTATFDSDTGKLSITLNNTVHKGRLISFAFSTASGTVAKYLDHDNPATLRDEDAFDNLRIKKGTHVRANPFGLYADGAGLDGKWKARRGRRGVAPGASETFVFDVTGAGANETVTDLIGSDSMSLVAAFKGLRHNRRDRIGASLQLVPSSVTPQSIDVTVDPSDETTKGGTAPGTSGTGGVPVITAPGPTGGGSTPTAVPLPPAAVTGLATMALAAGVVLRRRFGAVA